MKYLKNFTGILSTLIVLLIFVSCASGGTDDGLISNGGESLEPLKKHNGHEYVDLGLPSGLKWATCNVGATTPEGYGNYFAWGETVPKDYYDWSNYKYCDGTTI